MSDLSGVSVPLRAEYEGRWITVSVSAETLGRITVGLLRQREGWYADRAFLLRLLRECEGALAHVLTEPSPLLRRIRKVLSAAPGGNDGE